MNNICQMDAEVIVVGGGAAGLIAAGRAGEMGASVILLEKTDGIGKKIGLSGKTRCNLTNAAELKNFLAMYGVNGRFLHGVFSRFFRPELLSFLESRGLATKVERGGRIFPVSDDAADVVRLFKKYLAANKVKLLTNSRVVSVTAGEKLFFVVKTARRDYCCRSVVIAAGGASWPSTGSSGDGYKIIKSLGHTIVALRPALVPLVVRETRLVQSLQGVSLRNVRATVFAGEASSVDAALTPSCNYGRGEKKLPRPPVIESRFGEMLFTHFGLGGPIILLLSLAAVEALAKGPVSVLIDLKPALTKEQIRQRLQADMNAHGKRKISSILKDYLPAKMIEPFIELSGCNREKAANQISTAERESMIALFKALRFNIKSALPMAKAIVTAGGAALDEIDPRTMASKKVPGLYLGGEVLDIDADTGGYNLQAAFSTGFVAGENAALYAQAAKYGTEPQPATGTEGPLKIYKK